jgi:hypothetical protein
MSRNTPKAEIMPVWSPVIEKPDAAKSANFCIYLAKLSREGKRTAILVGNLACCLTEMMDL